MSFLRILQTCFLGFLKVFCCCFMGVCRVFIGFLLLFLGCLKVLPGVFKKYLALRGYKGARLELEALKLEY